MWHISKGPFDIFLNTNNDHVTVQQSSETVVISFTVQVPLPYQQLFPVLRKKKRILSHFQAIFTIFTVGPAKYTQNTTTQDMKISHLFDMSHKLAQFSQDVAQNARAMML